MTTSSRVLFMLSLGLFLLEPTGAAPAFSETQEKESADTPAPHKPGTETKPQPAPAPKADSPAEHKEGAPEKQAPRPPHPPAASDSQPTPHKPAPSPKADSPAEHKEGAPEKPAPRPPQPPAASESQPKPHKPPPETKPQSQPAPPVKADGPPESEVKEKEPPKKALGSLILSVKLALMADPKLFHYEIEVENDQQTVTLTGRVSTEEEKAAATEIAQAVQGVKTVVNKLAVEKDLAKTLLKKQDEILTALIKERFSKSATLKAANFEVKTEDGVVQLNGTVRFQVIALEAAEVARQVPGVRAVNTEKVRLEGES